MSVISPISSEELSLENFTFSVFEAELVLKEDAFLPPFKGSMLRGGLAWGIRKTACTENRTNCLECKRFDNCAYSYLFESMQTGPQKKEIPRPYLISLIDGNREAYRAGEILSFRLVLFGDAVNMLPFILLGLKHFANLGLGKKRAPFSLQKVTVVNPITQEKLPIYFQPDMYWDHTIVLNGCECLQNVHFDFPANSSSVELEFLTPTRLMEKGKLINKPTFSTIIRAALRRLSTITHYYGKGDMTADFKSLVATAETVELFREELKWVELKRYSNRKESHLYISGFVGKAEYRGNLKKLLPYLYLAHFCHIGKGTVYGLGNYNIKICL